MAFQFPSAMASGPTIWVGQSSSFMQAISYSFWLPPSWIAICLPSPELKCPSRGSPEKFLRPWTDGYANIARAQAGLILNMGGGDFSTGSCKGGTTVNPDFFCSMRVRRSTLARIEHVSTFRLGVKVTVWSRKEDFLRLRASDLDFFWKGLLR